MGFVFEEHEERTFSKLSPSSIESLTRAVAFETPPSVAREILQKIFETSTPREIATTVNELQALLVINIEGFSSYHQELAELIHIAHSKKVHARQVITTSLAQHVSAEVGVRFIEKAKSDTKEEAQRVSFLALVDALRSLHAIISLLVDKDQFVWMFTEAFMLVKSFVQATHIELIESALNEKYQKSKGGIKYQPRKTFYKVAAAILARTGYLSTVKFLRYLQKEYPDGYDLEGVRFTVARDSKHQITLAHASVNDPDNMVILSASTAKNYVSTPRSKLFK